MNYDKQACLKRLLKPSKRVTKQIIIKSGHENHSHAQKCEINVTMYVTKANFLKLYGSVF